MTMRRYHLRKLSDAQVREIRRRHRKRKFPKKPEQGVSRLVIHRIITFSTLSRRMTTEFSDLLSVLTEEDLIRFRWRLKRAKRYSAAELLGNELKQRELNANKESSPSDNRT